MRTKASVVNQTYQNFSWDIIDGGRDEETKKILADLPPRFRWFRQPDDGIYDAMNKGIENLSCDKNVFVIFLNAGDCFARDDVLLTLSEIISKEDTIPDFIYGDALELYPPSDVYKKKAKSSNSIEDGMFTHHQAMLFRSGLLGTMTYDTDYVIAADYKLTAQYLAKSQHIVYVDDAICLFETGGLSHKQSELGRREQARIRQEIFHSGFLKNIMVTSRQRSGNFIRKSFPWLYKKLRLS